MRLPWNTPKTEQLDLVDEASAGPVGSVTSDAVEKRVDTQTAAATVLPSLDELGIDGRPLLVPIDCLDEDSGNPRTEFPDEELAELAQDIALRGFFSRSSCAALAMTVATVSSLAPSVFALRSLQPSTNRARQVTVRRFIMA